MKQQAAEILRQHPSKGVTLVYILSTMGLSLLINLLIPNEFVSQLLLGNITSLNYTDTSYLFLTILITAFSWIMTFGYQYWALRFSRGESPPMSSLLEGFGLVGKVMFLTIYKASCMYFWISALSFALLMPIMYIVFFIQSPELSYAMLLCLLPFFLGAGFVLYLRYSFADYYIMTTPETTVGEAMSKSAKSQGKNLKSLLKFHFSFFLWFLAFLALQGLYSPMTSAFNTVLNPENLDAYSPYAFILSTFFDWILLLKFLPLYFVSFALYFQDTAS